MPSIRPYWVAGLATVALSLLAKPPLAAPQEAAVVNPAPEDLRQSNATFESACSTRQGLRSNPITYALDGKQYTFVTAGKAYVTFTLP